MDKEALVKSGHVLVTALDQDKKAPRLAMWVHATDSDTWKLWIVPPKGLVDKREFYREVSKVVSANRNELMGLDASDTEFVSDSHPALDGLKKFIKMEGLGSIYFSGNVFNGYYIPDGIILRSSI